MKKITNVFIFPNGNVAVTDEQGNQVPPLQGSLKELLQELYESKGYSAAEAHFHFPNGEVR